MFYSSFAVSPDYEIELTPEQPSTYSRATNDHITGSAAIDTVTFSGSLDQYVRTGSLASLASQDLVARRDGADELSGVERLAYTDVALALDIHGDAGLAYSLYGVFDRTPDLQGVGFWIDALDIGTAADVVAQGFIGSAEFVAEFGVSLTNEQYVEDLYQTFLDRTPDAQGFDYWVSNVQSGVMDDADVLVGFATSAEYQALITQDIANGVLYNVW